MKHSSLERIEDFIAQHHVLSLATSNAAFELSCCSVFYAYDASSMGFIFASDSKTTHIQHIQANPKVAANILLETDKVGLIQGLQIQGECHLVDDVQQKKLYFKTYPYALALAPTLWCLHVSSFKLTDNKLGFGKKLYYP